MAQNPDEYIDRIVVNPNVLVGKPVVRGTRISVELILEHLAENPNVAELIEAYPHITVDDIKACLAYARAVVASEDVFPTVSATS
jgi:uncharacterized protein (DUF433 family)